MTKPPLRNLPPSSDLSKNCDRMEKYYLDHPGSPSAVRRPRLYRRGGIFVVLLGRNLENGIVGFGNTVESALRAFDSQYLRALRPPVEKANASASRI